MEDRAAYTNPFLDLKSAYLNPEITCVRLLATLRTNRRTICIFLEERMTPTLWEIFGLFHCQGKALLTRGNMTDSNFNDLFSAMWIHLNTSDTTNTPKVGSTCTVIHERYALLADGCWGRGFGHCYSYGWNPLLYDICGGGWAWDYKPDTVGYTVPIAIRSIIGGR